MAHATAWPKGRLSTRRAVLAFGRFPGLLASQVALMGFTAFLAAINWLLTLRCAAVHVRVDTFGTVSSPRQPPCACTPGGLAIIDPGL